MVPGEDRVQGAIARMLNEIVSPKPRLLDLEEILEAS